MIADARSEDLSLVFQTPEGASMNNTIAVSLKGVSIRMSGFGIAASARQLNLKPQMRQHFFSISAAGRFFYLAGRSLSAAEAIWLIS
jgi:hypothetical protein